MTAQEFLRQYEYANAWVSRCKEQYDLIAEQVDAVGSTLGAGAGMPHGSGISRKAEDYIIRLSDAADKWLRAKAQAEEIKIQVMAVIRQVDGYEGLLLYERYINLLEWESVAEKLGYTVSGVYKLRRRALEAVEDILMCGGIGNGNADQRVSGQISQS